MEEDFIARANALADSIVTKGIERAQQREPMPQDFDGDCECGEKIPEARVALGYYRCVSCQSTLEKRGRQFNLR